MSPLNLEVFNPQGSEWRKVGELKPGQPPGSISQNKPDGSREIYFFECNSDDSESIIYRSKAGVDAATSHVRSVGTAGLETVRVLKNGESHTISIKVDTSDVRRIIRLLTPKQRNNF